MLPDGSYDIVVVDADDADEGAVTLHLAVLAGPHKGEVLTLTGRGMGRDPLDLLAVPGTLTVAEGAPSVRLEG